METSNAFLIIQIHKDDPVMVFDWNKAARIIKEQNPKIASAGLSGDWE